MSKNWKNWSPFQSPEVREICSHMTMIEWARASRRSGLYGIWVGVTFAIPLSALPFFAIIEKSWAIIVIAAVLLAVHIACLPIWQKRTKRFLYSTAWAREQGLTSEGLM